MTDHQEYLQRRTFGSLDAIRAGSILAVVWHHATARGLFDLPMADAVGTSLVVITVTSAVALTARHGAGVVPEWPPVLVLTAVAAVGAVLGARVGHRVSGSRLQAAFAVLVLVVAMYTTVRAVPEVLGGLLPT